MTRPCPGPLPAKSPKLKAPAGACDTHIHVVGPYAKYPLVPERTFTSPEAPYEMLREFIDVMGMDRVVIVHVTVSGADPAVTLDALAELGDRGRGIVILDMEASDSEMRRMHDGGIRGARLTPLFGGPVDANTVNSLAAKLADYGWHMLFMPSDPEQWLTLAPLLGQQPVDVVVDHMAWRGWQVEDGPDSPGFRALRDLARTRSRLDKVRRHVSLFAGGSPLARSQSLRHGDGRGLPGPPHLGHRLAPCPDLGFSNARGPRHPRLVKRSRFGRYHDPQNLG